MKGTMDGAAKSADKVAQSILPDCPHHLSVSLTRRFPPPEGSLFTGPGIFFTGPSEPLQYLTYVSDASRGILLTRPSYDIIEETEKPPATMPAKVLAKGEVKKKMSFKDYQNRKKSVSPADQEQTIKTETKPNGVPELKLTKENGKVESVKPREKLPEKPQNTDTRTEKPRSEVNGERNSQPSKQALDIGSRKRLSEADRDLPPQKRPRTETENTRLDQSNRSKNQTPRPKDRPNEKPQKESRDFLHPLNNEVPSSSLDRDVSASPKSTIQVNGTRPHPDSGRSTPRRGDHPTKPSLPALLSPLHPSLFEGGLDERERSRKKPVDKPPAKNSKSENAPVPKKAKAPIKIPELLSPTLPPIVEAELARVKKTPSKGDEVQKNIRASESPTSARKTRVVADPIEEEATPSRPSRIVTLKLKKTNAKRAKDLLSLPSKSIMNALRKERSESVDNTPPPARKRPRIAEEVLAESAPPKRSKITSEILSGSKPSGLSTPLKQTATAMSRVASNQSQGNTPGNTTGLTPGTVERRPASFDGPPENPVMPAKTRQAIDSLKARSDEYRKLGSKLKHTRDDLVNKTRGPNITPSDEKRIAALHLEMILAYMICFHTLNQSRALERKVPDIGVWESLVPHLHELQNRQIVASNRALKALALQMHALCLEQITSGYATCDPVMAGNRFKQWVKLERSRPLVWAEAVSQSDGVEDRRMKTLIGPWTKVEDAVASAMAIMRKWAEREDVPWRPDILQDKEKEKEKGKEGQRDRDRDRGDRDRERERERERERDPRERERDRDRDRERDRERDPRDPRERDRDRERERARDRDRERDRDRDGHRDSHRERERERDRERDRDRLGLNGTGRG